MTTPNAEYERHAAERREVDWLRRHADQRALEQRLGLSGGRTVDPYHLRGTTRDGDLIVLGRCPGCGAWGDLDDDQLSGLVSTHHDTSDGGCGYHDTVNWIERYTA